MVKLGRVASQRQLTAPVPIAQLTQDGPFAYGDGMTLHEIEAALQQHRAVLVHFSHDAEMRPGVHFPHDLRGAVLNAGKWKLCCHVLTPGHSVQVVGSMGVVLDLLSAESVLGVSNTDAGSDQDGGLGHELTPETLVCSLTPADDEFRYNEWYVRGARVRGFFVHEPDDILVRRAHPEFGQATGPIELPELREVLASIASLPIYTMTGDGLVRL